MIPPLETMLMITQTSLRSSYLSSRRKLKGRLSNLRFPQELPLLSPVEMQFVLD